MSKNRFPSREQVESLRETYPTGTKITIVSMSDPYVNMPQGTTGVVTHVDDTGTVFAKWSNGSGLGAVYGEDIIRKLTEDEIVQEQILAIRATGRTNMFDVNAVQRIANDMDFYELVIFIEEHRDRYVRFILTGTL